MVIAYDPGETYTARLRDRTPPALVAAVAMTREHVADNVRR